MIIRRWVSSYNFATQFVDAYNTAEAGDTLVAKDRREERTQRVRPVLARVTRVECEAESLRRQLARVQAARRDDKQAADAAAIAASRAAHPRGDPSAERHKLWRQQRLAGKTSGAGLSATTKSTKLDLDFTSPEFE